MAKTRAELELRATDKASGVFKRFQSRLTGINRTLRKSERRFQLFSRRVDKSLGSINKLSKKMNRIGKDMTTRMTLPIAAAGGVALNEFRKFEKGLIGVSKTTDLAGSNLERFGSRIIEMSKGMPLSADQLLNLAEAAGQMGIRGSKNLLAFTETMAKLQFTTDVVGDEGARAIARILKITGEGPQKIKPFADTLVFLGNTLEATESEILGVANRIAGNVSRFKLSSTEILGLAGSLKALGKESELAGSVTGKVFNAIQQSILDGGKNKEGLKTLRILTGGLSRQELKRRFDAEPLKLFIKVMKGLQKVSQSKTGNFVSVLKNLKLEGVRVNDILGTLVTSLDGVIAKQEELRKGVQKGALDKEFANFMQSFDADIKKTLNSLKSLAISVGRLLAPMFRSFLSVVRDVSGFLERNKGFTRVLVVFGGIVAVLGPLLATLGGLGMAFVAINKVLPIALGAMKGFLGLKIGAAFKAIMGGKFLTAFTALLGPIGAVTLALGGVVSAIWAIRDAWPDLKTATLESIVNWLKHEFGLIDKAIKKFVGVKPTAPIKKLDEKTQLRPQRFGRDVFMAPPRANAQPTTENRIEVKQNAELKIEIESEEGVKAKVKNKKNFDSINIVRGFQGARL